MHLIRNKGQKNQVKTRNMTTIATPKARQSTKEQVVVETKDQVEQNFGKPSTKDIGESTNKKRRKGNSIRIKENQ